MSNHRGAIMSTPRNRSLRRSRAVAVVAAAGLLVTACGSPPTAQNAGPGRSSSGAKDKLPTCPLDALKKAKGPVNVKLWFSGIVAPPVTVLERLVKDFNASQNKVVVTADNQGVSYSEGMRKYEGASATPKQLPQVMYVEDTDLGELVDKGQLLPAQSCMDADGYDTKQIVPAARAAYEVDGNLYSPYMNVATPVLYYNKVHFQKAGLDPNKPPTTIAEVEAAAKKIKAAGVAPKPLSFIANEWFLSTWMAGIGQNAVNNGNGRKAPPTKATFDTPKVQGVLETLARMKKEGVINPFPVVDGKIDHYLALITEQSSMLIETSTASGTIAQALGGNLDPKASGVDLGSIALDTQKVFPGAAAMPGIEAPGKIYAGGGGFYMLNTSSPAQQAATWEFMKFMLKPENSKRWTIEGGYLPMLKATVDDPDVKKSLDTGLQGALLTPGAAQLAAADPDSAGPLIGPYGAYQKGLRGALDGVLFNDKDPKAALAQAQTDVTKALQAYNGSN
jgi:sn-glycerol 3-phosphate transport system substrate-binding protein